MIAFSTPSFAVDIQDAYHRSYSYEKVQVYDDAIKSLMLVYQEYPDGYTVNLRLGWLYYLKHSYTNALHHYSQAIKILPYSAEAKLGYTLPLIAQHRWSDVEQLLSQVLKTDYYNYYGNLRYSYILRMQKKYDLAETVLRKMLNLYPTDVSIQSEFALLKKDQGELSAAKAIYQDILILDPENFTAKTYLEKK